MWEFNEEVKYIQAMLCSCLLFFFRGGGGKGGGRGAIKFKI